MNWKKILGIVAIVGVGVIIYAQYKKAKKEKEQIKGGTGAKRTTVNVTMKPKIKGAFKEKIAGKIQQQNQ